MISDAHGGHYTTTVYIPYVFFLSLQFNSRKNTLCCLMLKVAYFFWLWVFLGAGVGVGIAVGAGVASCIVVGVGVGVPTGVPATRRSANVTTPGRSLRCYTSANQEN
jgi:hypothetical protein